MRDAFAGCSDRYPACQIVQGPRGATGPRGDALRWEDLTVEQVYALIPKLKFRVVTLEPGEKATVKVYGPKDKLEVVLGIPRGKQGSLDVDIVRIFGDSLRAFMDRKVPLLDPYPWYPEPKPKRPHHHKHPICKAEETEDEDDEYGDEYDDEYADDLADLSSMI